MTNEDTDSKNISLSVPVGALATALLLAGAALAYNYISSDEEGSPLSSLQGVAQKARPGGGNMRKKLGLKTLIAVIENETSRKMLVAVLKAMARRS